MGFTTLDFNLFRCFIYIGNQRGISGLQRIGIGLGLSIVAMIVAATVEVHRLRLVREHNLLDNTHTPVPMTVFWEIPQYILMGASEVLSFYMQCFCLETEITESLCRPF